MSATAHQQAAIRRLEALFRDVKLEQQHQCSPEVVKVEVDSSCCDIHGKHAKENCWNRRSSMSSAQSSRRDSLGRRDSHLGTSPSRRGSIGLPMSPPRKELHPSSFPNTLRKNPLGSSMGAINHSKKDSYTTIGSAALRRDPIGRSMGCLKKDTATNYNSPLRRDYVAKSMTSLQRPSQRRDANTLSSLFATSPTLKTSLKSGLSASNSDLKTNSASNLKSCFAGSSGNLRGNLNVTLSADLTGSNGNLRKDRLALPISGRRGSYDRRRLSTDSLDNTKRNSWDPGRRGSSGSSGGWDDPIWEESVDQVKRSHQLVHQGFESFTVFNPMHPRA